MFQQMKKRWSLSSRDNSKRDIVKNRSTFLSENFSGFSDDSIDIDNENAYFSDHEIKILSPLLQGSNEQDLQMIYDSTTSFSGNESELGMENSQLDSEEEKENGYKEFTSSIHNSQTKSRPSSVLTLSSQPYISQSTNLTSDEALPSKHMENTDILKHQVFDEDKEIILPVLNVSSDLDEDEEYVEQIVETGTDSNDIRFNETLDEKKSMNFELAGRAIHEIDLSRQTLERQLPDSMEATCMMKGIPMQPNVIEASIAPCPSITETISQDESVFTPSKTSIAQSENSNISDQSSQMPQTINATQSLPTTEIEMLDPNRSLSYRMRSIVITKENIDEGVNQDSMQFMDGDEIKLRAHSDIQCQSGDENKESEQGNTPSSTKNQSKAGSSLKNKYKYSPSTQLWYSPRKKCPIIFSNDSNSHGGAGDKNEGIRTPLGSSYRSSACRRTESSPSSIDFTRRLYRSTSLSSGIGKKSNIIMSPSNLKSNTKLDRSIKLFSNTGRERVNTYTDPSKTKHELTPLASEIEKTNDSVKNESNFRLMLSNADDVKTSKAGHSNEGASTIKGLYRSTSLSSGIGKANNIVMSPSNVALNVKVDRSIKRFSNVSVVNPSEGRNIHEGTNKANQSMMNPSQIKTSIMLDRSVKLFSDVSDVNATEGRRIKEGTNVITGLHECSSLLSETEQTQYEVTSPSRIIKDSPIELRYNSSNLINLEPEGMHDDTFSIMRFYRSTSLASIIGKKITRVMSPSADCTSSNTEGRNEPCSRPAESPVSNNEGTCATIQSRIPNVDDEQLRHISQAEVEETRDDELVNNVCHTRLQSPHKGPHSSSPSSSVSESKDFRIPGMRSVVLKVDVTPVSLNVNAQSKEVSSQQHTIKTVDECSIIPNKDMMLSILTPSEASIQFDFPKDCIEENINDDLNWAYDVWRRKGLLQSDTNHITTENLSPMTGKERKTPLGSSPIGLSRGIGFTTLIDSKKKVRSMSPSPNPSQTENPYGSSPIGGLSHGIGFTTLTDSKRIVRSMSPSPNSRRSETPLGSSPNGIARGIDVAKLKDSKRIERSLSRSPNPLKSDNTENGGFASILQQWRKVSDDKPCTHFLSPESQQSQYSCAPGEKHFNFSNVSSRDSEKNKNKMKTEIATPITAPSKNVFISDRATEKEKVTNLSTIGTCDVQHVCVSSQPLSQPRVVKDLISASVLNAFASHDDDAIQQMIPRPLPVCGNNDKTSKISRNRLSYKDVSRGYLSDLGHLDKHRSKSVPRPKSRTTDSRINVPFVKTPEEIMRALVRPCSNPCDHETLDTNNRSKSVIRLRKNSQMAISLNTLRSKLTKEYSENASTTELMKESKSDIPSNRLKSETKKSLVNLSETYAGNEEKVVAFSIDNSFKDSNDAVDNDARLGIQKLIVEIPPFSSQLVEYTDGTDEHCGSQAKQSLVENFKKSFEICRCSSSLFSGNDELIDFFLPLTGTACVCGMHPSGLRKPDEPTSLVNILRTWQVEFLASYGIHRGDELVKAHHRSSQDLAKALRKYRMKYNMKTFRTKNCLSALKIWSKTSKAFVRSIRAQIAAGTAVTDFELPNPAPFLNSFIDFGSPSAATYNSTSAASVCSVGHASVTSRQSIDPTLTKTLREV